MTTLKKIDDRLYHEVVNDGEPVKWIKRLHPFTMALFDLTVHRVLSNPMPTANESPWPGILDKLPIPTETPPKVTISGQADMGFDPLELIIDGGKSSKLSSKSGINRVAVFLLSNSDRDVNGNLIYVDRETAKRYDVHPPSHYLQLTLPIGETYLDALAIRLQSARDYELKIEVAVDTFEATDTVQYAIAIDEFRISYNSASLMSITDSQRIGYHETGRETKPDTRFNTRVIQQL